MKPWCTYTYIYIHIYICTHVHMCRYIYICTYIHIRIHLYLICSCYVYIVYGYKHILSGYRIHVLVQTSLPVLSCSQHISCVSMHCHVWESVCMCTYVLSCVRGCVCVLWRVHTHTHTHKQTRDCEDILRLIIGWAFNAVCDLVFLISIVQDFQSKLLIDWIWAWPGLVAKNWS